MTESLFETILYIWRALLNLSKVKLFPVLARAYVFSTRRQKALSRLKLNPLSPSVTS